MFGATTLLSFGGAETVAIITSSIPQSDATGVDGSKLS